MFKFFFLIINTTKGNFISSNFSKVKVATLFTASALTNNIITEIVQLYAD